LAHKHLIKVEITGKQDENTKIGREFHLTKSMYNKIIDIVEVEGSSFSEWVRDACNRKLKEG
jgi:hypothetical protein